MVTAPIASRGEGLSAAGSGTGARPKGLGLRRAFRVSPAVRIGIRVALFTVLFLTTSCGDRGAPSGSRGDLAQQVDRTPRRGGTLRIALERPMSLDPAGTDDVYEATVVNQIFSGLLRLDANLNVLPELAQSWTISRDWLTYRFDLRQDARFHNGRPVVAQDFVYSFSRLLDPKRVRPGIIQDYLLKIEGAEAYREGRVDSVAGLRALDAHTLEIHLDQPYPSFLSVLTMDQAKAIPREAVERMGAEAFGRHPVGSGPYRFDLWDPATEIRLLANPDYFGGRANIDTLIFVQPPSTDDDWRKPAFLAGKLDLIEVREQELASMMAQGNYRVIRRPELSMDFLGFNLQHPLLRDVRVRRAMAMAIDRTALKAVAGQGFEAPSGLLPPGLPGFSPRSKVVPYDPDHARRLLAEAGYSTEHPLHLPLMTGSRTAYAEARDSVVVASLKAVGVQVDLQHVTWDEFDKALMTRRLAAFQLSWIADLPDPDSFLYSLFVSGGASNFFAYSDAGVDSLLDEGCRNLDQVARLNEYRQAEVKILKDAPIVPLFNTVGLYLLQPDVRGVELSPFGICSVPMDHIWLDGTTRSLHARL